MARLAIAIAPGVGRVHGVLGSPDQVAIHIGDREANGDAFPGETWIRLPARLRVGATGRIEPVEPRYYPRSRKRAQKGAGGVA